MTSIINIIFFSIIIILIFHFTIKNYLLNNKTININNFFNKYVKNKKPKVTKNKKFNIKNDLTYFVNNYKNNNCNLLPNNLESYFEIQNKEIYLLEK